VGFPFPPSYPVQKEARNEDQLELVSVGEMPASFTCYHAIKNNENTIKHIKKPYTIRQKIFIVTRRIDNVKGKELVINNFAQTLKVYCNKEDIQL
jgi:hypothetical protein